MSTPLLRERAAGLRLLRIVVIVNSLAIVAALGLLLLAFQTIQQSRVSALRNSCEDTNQRHARTIQTLDERIAKLPPAQQVRARASRDFTLALIDDLAPQTRDCDARAHRLTQ